MEPSSPRCVSTTAGTSWTSAISPPPGTSSWPAGSPRPPRPESSSRTRWCWPPPATTARPTSRTVLCKGVDERGVVFYTNYTSAKSHELRSIRRASATFPWYAHAAAGAACAATSSWSPRRRPAPTGRPGRGARSWARGRRRSRPTCATATPSTTPRGRRAPLRRHRRGAGAAALGRLADRARTASSSGRAGPTGCTTGCGSSRTPSTGRGRSAASPPDPAAHRPSARSWQHGW